MGVGMRGSIGVDTIYTIVLGRWIRGCNGECSAMGTIGGRGV